MNTVLSVQRAPGLTTLTLERADKGSALSAELVSQLDAALQAAEADGTRLLVITGAGKHFCTGFDLSELDAETDDTLLARFVRVELLLQRLHAAPYATLALARGRVMGAGADLFAACEHRWALDDASFAFPGAGFGLVLGTARLAALVGSSRARDWVASGRTVAVDEALAAGLATARKRSGEVGEAQAALHAQQQRLDATTHRGIRAASRERGEAGAAADLLALVQSAARPGLKERILRYRELAARDRGAGRDRAQEQVIAEALRSL